MAFARPDYAERSRGSRNTNTGGFETWIEERHEGVQIVSSHDYLRSDRRTVALNFILAISVESQCLPRMLSTVLSLLYSRYNSAQILSACQFCYHRNLVSYDSYHSCAYGLFLGGEAAMSNSSFQANKKLILFKVPPMEQATLSALSLQIKIRNASAHVNKFD